MPDARLSGRNTWAGKANSGPAGSPTASAITTRTMTGAVTNGSSTMAKAETPRPAIVKAVGRPDCSARKPLSGMVTIITQPMMLRSQLAWVSE